MSGNLRLALIILVSVVAVTLVVNIVGRLLHYLIPLAVLSAVALIGYSVAKKALTGGRRTLP